MVKVFEKSDTQDFLKSPPSSKLRLIKERLAMSTAMAAWYGQR